MAAAARLMRLKARRIYDGSIEQQRRERQTFDDAPWPHASYFRLLPL